MSIAIPLFFLLWVFEGGRHQSPRAGPSLRSWPGLVEDKSCDVDVVDELLPELVDNPGATRGTKLSVLHNRQSALPSNWDAGEDDRPFRL